MKEKLTFYFKKFPALSHAATIVFFILIEGLYSFCTTPRSRPIECPAFNDPNYDAWFNYQQGQVLRFTSSLGKKDSMTLSRVFKSMPFTGYGSCNSSAQVRSAEIFEFNAKLDLSYTKGNMGNSLFITVLGFSTRNNLESYSIIPLPGSLAFESFQSTVTLNGKSFSNVVLLQRDTTNPYKPPGAYKVWISKGNGLVAYEMFSNGETWVRD